MNIDDLHRTSLMFLRVAIEKIVADSAIKRKENAQLKKACEHALEELKSLEAAQGGVQVNGTNGILPDVGRGIEADRFFLPFELACRSKSPKIVSTSLDCIQKLIAFGQLTGKGPDPSNPDRLLIDRIVEAICSAFHSSGNKEDVLLQIIKALLVVILSPTCEVHESALLMTVKTCFNIYLTTTNPVNQATAKGSLAQVINKVFTNMEEHGSDKDDPTIVRDVMDYLVTCTVNECSGLDESDSRSRGAGSTVAESELPNEDQCQFPNVYQKDAYLVFRALCILAQKEDSEPNQGNYGLQSKILAMEMILLILQNSSTVVQNSKPFIVLIKKTLCVALSRNANSPVEEFQVFEKSLAIFVQLLDKFKVHLKLQIEVFFREIIISMLDSATCSFQHKWIVLNTIAKILGNPQSIVDLFVNYDCDMTSHNVFRSLVDVVSKTAGTAISINSPPDVRIGERSMRLMGLSCLSDLLHCLVEWFDACEIVKFSTRNNDSDDGITEEPLSPSVHQFEHLKLQKDLMEQGILVFGQKPKKGLEFLQKHGFVGTDPVEIAEFLTKEDRLDKTTVGDYLGDPDEFNKQVMYAYVDDMDFSQSDIVTALRLFLEKFRLPGEAQKIDRLMEKFASRYCECNPSLGMFASADTAYVLAYSIILLTTDLHSAQVKNKMTKDQYVKMNRGINNGGDLPRDLIEAVYDDISKNEIKMKAGASKLLKSTNAQLNSDKQKKVMTALELDAISETARSMMESASLSDSNFTPAQHQHHVKPMFKICWTPCLAAFSQGIQSSDDFEEWSICIRGFRLGVRAACILRSGVQRKAFIQALARFTCLNGRTGMSEIREKNVDIIKLLLQIGDEDGDFLEESWHDIIKCISQLELAQLIGTGTGSSISHKDKDSVRNYVKMNTGSLDERTLASLQGTLGETTSQAVVIAVDKIFHGSSRLSGEGIVHFVTALCDVSREELSQLGAPRMFLLQKLVEVAFYNMSRIRLEWRRIWVVVGAHFDMAGCNTNDVVAHFAVDALRQLAFKFLEKGELPAFRFQKDFLRPFEVIVNTNRSIITRELVVHCCSILVDAHADRLKSGWLNLFSVWKKVAVDTNADILEKAFSSCEKVIRVHFDKDFASVLDSFQEAISCLAEFACNTINQDIQMEAIKLIKRCAEYVANKTQIILDAPYELQGNESYRVNDDQKVWLRGWFPIFFELHTIINRTKLDARTSSLSTLFQIMRNHGETFHTDWWKDLFNIVFRIFDKAKREERSDKREWMMTTCHHALLSVVEVYTQFFSVLGSMLLPAIYEQCALCIQQHHEQLAKNAITCLETLILSNGHRFDEEMWQQTIVLFRNLFSSTLPKSLLTWQPTSSSDHSSNGLLSPGNSSIKRGGSPFSDDEASNDTRVPSIDGRPNGMPHPDAIFSEQIVFCVVQSELVDTVTRIVLGTKTVTERDNVQSTLRSPKPNQQTDKEPLNGTASFCLDDGLFSILSPPLLLSLVEALAESQRLAKQFNDNNGQRTLLWKAGLRGASKPNLIRQETHALRAMLAILLRLLSDPRSEEVKKQVAQGVLGVVSAALCGYGEAGSETRRSAYSPVVCELLNECIQLPDELIPNLGPEFPLRLCELVETAEGQTLRSLLSTLLKRFLAREGIVNGHCTSVEEQLHVDA